MPESCRVHKEHAHQHGPTCGHTAIQHEGHTDYLHEGHLHHSHADHVDEHVIAIDAKHPASAKAADHNCGGHPQGHKHGPGCGHEAVPHGDHQDYLVNGHLHHPESNGCSNHGSLEVRAAA
jgi:hypothetical protein